MKDFLFFLLKVIIYLIIGLSIWWIIKTPQYVPIIYIGFLIALLLAYLTNDKEIQIFVVLSSIFISGSIVLLHSFQPKYNILIDKIIIILETLFIIGVFLFLQKKSWSLDVYSTTFIEQIENLEKEISRISDEIRDLQTKIYNINEIKNNFKTMQEIITTLGSVSSISVVKTYVVNLIHKLLPGAYVGLYLTHEEVPKNTLEEEVVRYIKLNNKYFFSNDVVYLLQKFKTSYLCHNLFDIKSILGFPIKIYSSSENGDTGYLVFFSLNEINEETLRLLSIFSSYVGVTISNIKLIEYTQNLAITDTLTGLYVHRYFKELLEEEINRAKYYNRIFSLAMFDIDNFKHINDTYGHNVGDLVLVKFSEILRKRLREVDKIFRYGGDEFAIIFPDTSISNAEKICEEIRNIVLNETIVIPSTSFNVSSLNRIKFTISGGVMEYSNEYSLESFINSVDKLLYKSKTTGKNKITCQKK